MKKISFFLVPAILLIMFTNTAVAQAPIPVAPLVEKTTWTDKEVRELAEIYAKKWEIKQNDFLLVVWNESHFKAGAHNKTDSHKNSKGSHGPAQFASGTFRDNASEMFKKGLTTKLYTDMYNPEQAFDVMGYMIANKKGRAWTGYRTCVLHEVIIYKGKQIKCYPLPAVIK